MTINYLISLDPKSITFSNCVTYVRRRMGGVSLVTQELLAPWTLKDSMVCTFAISMVLQAKIMISKEILIEQNISPSS